MDAVISGQAGKALLLNGNSLTSFDVDDPATLVPGQQADLRFLFGEAGDLRILENTNLADVTRELRRARDCDDALDLTLISFDPELPAEIRREAIEELEELLADEYVIEHLEYVLYGRPLPASADITGALNHCGEAHAANAQAMLRSLRDRQAGIREVSTAWDAIPSDIFGGYEERAEFQRVAVREGLFCALVTAREAQTTAAFFLTAVLNASVKALRNHRQVLQQWIAPFRQSNGIREINRKTDERALIESPIREQRGRRRSIDRDAVLQKVKSQKALITDTMQRLDLARVGKLVDELVNYQLENGEAIHAAKSLCDLAFEAKTLGLYSLQLELAKRSTDVKPDDAWSWAQYGDALLKMQRPGEALKAYEQAEAFGADTVAKNRRAEVLKSLGRLNESLAAYDAVIASYPEDVVARTARSCVLAALHRYDEALEGLPHEKPITRGEWIGYHIRGMILLRMGKADEAVQIFEHGVKNDPLPFSKEYSRTALTVALLRQRDFVKAGQMLDEVTAPLLQPQANILRLHAFGAQGNIERVTTAYQSLTSSPPLFASELIEELSHQYISDEAPRHDDEWVFNQEVDVLLLIASEQAMISNSSSAFAY
ncbi:MAG: hypothetical protein ABR577_01860 [Pyrinomonadaceae bacterium]